MSKICECAISVKIAIFYIYFVLSLETQYGFYTFSTFSFRPDTVLSARYPHVAHGFHLGRVRNARGRVVQSYWRTGEC